MFAHWEDNCEYKRYLALELNQLPCNHRREKFRIGWSDYLACVNCKDRHNRSFEIRLKRINALFISYKQWIIAFYIVERNHFYHWKVCEGTYFFLTNMRLQTTDLVNIKVFSFTKQTFGLNNSQTVCLRRQRYINFATAEEHNFNVCLWSRINEFQYWSCLKQTER